MGGLHPPTSPNIESSKVTITVLLIDPKIFQGHSTNPWIEPRIVQRLQTSVWIEQRILQGRNRETTRKPNDFDLISNYLFCDVFILTSIAENHLTTFGTVENIINTKMKLKKCLKDKSNFIDGRNVNKESILERNKEILKKTLGLLSKDVELDNISFKPPSGRGNIIDKHNGQIIDQTYNAHPDTVLATANEENPNETILILGDMAELGDKEHEMHFDLIEKLSKYEIFLTGPIYNGLKDKIENNADDKKLIDDLSKKVISDFTSEYEKLSSLSRETLEPLIKSLIDKHKTNFKGVGQPLRIALVGSRFGPGLYDVILSLDKTEVLKRLKQI